jgi:hypothetical protein
MGQTRAALGLTWLMATGTRPEHPTMDVLVVFLASGQLLALPLAIVLVRRELYGLVVAVLAITTAVHFVPYTWLYSTPVYVVAAATVAVVTSVLLLAAVAAMLFG